MDIPKRKFIQHALSVAGDGKSAIKVERKAIGAGGYQGGGLEDHLKRLERQPQRATIWTISNARTGASLDVVDTDELMPAADAIAQCEALEMAPPAILQEPAPSFTIDVFRSYLKDKKVSSKFDPKKGRYELKKPTSPFTSKRTYLHAPGHQGDPEFGDAFIFDAVRACNALDIEPPSSLFDEDSTYSEALLLDKLAAENPNIRMEEVPNERSIRFRDISDDTIKSVEVPMAPDRVGWIGAGHVVYACNAMRVAVPDDVPETLAMPLFLGKARTRARLVSDAIAAAQREVDMDNDDTEIIEELANSSRTIRTPAAMASR